MQCNVEIFWPLYKVDIKNVYSREILVREVACLGEIEKTY